MNRSFLFILLLFSLCAVCLHATFQNAPPSPDDLVKRAIAAYEAGHYAESIALYKQSLESLTETDRAGTEYNLACALALAGDRSEALDTLARAAEDGYADRKDTEADKDLVSLHGDPRWEPLLGEMEQFKGFQDKRWGDAAFNTPYAANISDADKLAGLSELWAQAKYGFANFWHVPDLNWDQTYRAFIPQVLATKSTEEYYKVLERFYALLHDGHSNVYSPAMLNGGVRRLDLQTRLVEGHMLIIGAYSPTTDLQGLQPGDEIVSINGEPAVAWVGDNVAPFVSASSPQDRETRSYEYLPFIAPVGTRFEFGIETPAGKRATHSFVVGDGDHVHKPLFEFKMLPGGVAYVALNGFDDDTAAKEWDRNWPQIQKAKALVLDLRENGGGDDSVGYHILSSLISKDVPAELSRSTRWIASYRAWGDAEAPIRFPLHFVQPDPARHFDGPGAMLTSARTFSAGEDMAVVFAQAHRGLIVGEPTGGSTGQPLFFKLPGGGAARICTKHDSYADGREFVGVGVQPDIPVALTRRDIVAGRDPVLASALQVLQER